jgi:outer membrane protein OmpA-like peptidoglycan-associated protein
LAAFPRLVGVAAAFEGGDDAESIVRALRYRTKRGEPDRLSSERRTIERLKSVRKRRGLNLQERDELYEATRKMPQVDLTVYFAFDSATILPEGAAKLDKLGQALSQSEFNGSNIVINGHTDRKGTADYNLALSERRAIAAMKYLVDRFNLDPERFMANGFGFERLSNPKDPFSGENRRVQIVNAGS